MTKKVWFVAPAMWLFSLAAYGADALVAGYHLKPASAVVKVGGTVKLRLVYCFLKGKPRPAEVTPRGKLELKMGEPVEVTLGGEVELKIGDPVEVTPGGEVELKIGDPVEVTPGGQDRAPPLYLACEGDDGYGDEPASHVIPDMKWEVVDGQGRVTGDKDGATYHAPASKPTPNRATVAVTFKDPLRVGGKSYPKAKQTLLSRITILDEVKSYTGTFSMHDVTVNSEYTTNLNGNIRWEFDEYYEEGQWREYVGKGTAAISVERKSCGGPVGFTNVPVEGRLKVYDDKRYEFLINLVSDEEIKRTCRRHTIKWEEPFSPGGHAMNQGDPCGLKEFYPQYGDVTDLSLNREGGCANVRNRYQEGWSFKAVE